MNRIAICTLALLAAACQPPETEVPAPEPATMAEPGAVAPEQTNPAPEAPVADVTPESVLQTWANALETGDWSTARAQWGENGSQSGLSEAEFAATYHQYKTIHIDIADAETEGAAGSLYYQPEVTMTGEMVDGQPFRMVGPVTVKRVNDVPGATEEQLRWHIASSDLKPRPVE